MGGIGLKTWHRLDLHAGFARAAGANLGGGREKDPLRFRSMAGINPVWFNFTRKTVDPQQGFDSFFQGH